MKRLLSFLLLLHIFSLSHSQEEFDSLSQEPYFPFELFIGKKIHQNTFYNQLNTYKSFDYLSPVTLVGIGVNSQLNISRTYSYCGNVIIAFIIPQIIAIDNLGEGKITGYTFSFSIAGFDVFKNSKWLKLFCSTGINTGKIRIINNDMVWQRNLYLSPMVSVCPKFIIKKLTVAFNFQYDYDITNARWKRAWFAEHKRVDLGSFRQTGITVYTCFGLEL
jgi:hypothetical protein